MIQGKKAYLHAVSGMKRHHWSTNGLSTRTQEQIQSQVLTKCWTKTSLKDVFIVKIFFEIIFSCDIMFEDKR